MTNLSERNKNALIICAIFLLFFFTVQFIFLPVLNKRKNLKRIIQTNKSNVTRMIALRQGYNVSDKDIEENKTLLIKRGKNFSLFSHLDATAKNCGVKKNVVFMKPSFQNLKDSDYKKAFVKVKLESISLEECIAFLDKIENLKARISINSFSISTTGENNKLLDIIIETETIMLISYEF